jgi:hypothetical protein
MGNIVVFQRRADGVPLDPPRDHRLVCGESKDLDTDYETGLPRCIPAEDSTSQASPTVFKGVGTARFAPGARKTLKHPDHDAYLLVLLADQELTEGRDAEARCLLDAAYAAFDRQTADQKDRLASG